ncbi:anchor [Clostridium collagenovorans DSM 3089]|uniref:Anchor n=1 Tax=Clostridium collagenovorans DSM 3089 TaxID=1121306 RepID=A0A1M5YBK0_9CLOT|nr:hypothetical protein [Clostridium collagenovorans]SHI08873.1 anchor [Clostridium collagenovorans DSM 3089]
MKKLNKSLCFMALITLLCIPISNHSVYAKSTNDIFITETYTSNDGYWYPGRSESKTFSILNNMEQNILINRLYLNLNSCANYSTNEFLSIKSKEFKEISKNCNVTLMKDNNKLLSTTLCDLLSNDGVILDEKLSLSSKDSQELTLLIDFNSEMNNNAQGLELDLSIALAYEENTAAIGSGNSTNGSINKGSTNTLPQTGSSVDRYLIFLAIGLVSAVSGLALMERDSIKKGGVQDE